MHDVGLAMGTLLAEATHEGVSLQQMAGISKDKVVENFDIDTEDLAVVSIAAMGYQDESRLEELEEKYQKSEYQVRERKELTELVFGASLDRNPDWLN